MGRKVRSFGHHSRFRNSMIFLLIAVMITVGFAAVSPAWANDDSRISGDTIAADGNYNASVTAVPNTDEEGIRNLNDEVRVKVKDGVIEKISFKGVGTDPQTESNAADPAERSDVFSKALKELRKTNDPVGAAASESALKEIFEASDDQNETVREPAAGWLSGKKDPDYVYSVNLTQAIIKAVRSAEARETNEEEHEVKDKVHSKNVEKPQENTEKDSQDADTSVSENKTEQAAAADDERSAEMNVPAEENNADPAGSLEGSSGPAKIAAMNKIAAASGIRKVSGNQIAKDGTYGAYFSVAKYEDGKYKKNYTGILYVVVSNGKISNLIYSGEKSSKISPVLKSSGYIGQTASVTVIQNASVDAVSSASLNTGGSASASRSGKSYVMDLKSTIITALQSADAAEGTTSETVHGVADGVYKGSSSNSQAAGDEADYKITVNVTVKDGKITDVSAVEDETTGSWDSLLQTVKSEVVDTPAAVSNVDAVSSATTKGWKAAVQNAVKNALNSTASETGDDSGSSSGGTGTASDSGKTIKGSTSGVTVNIYEGESVTLSCDDDTSSSLYSHSWSVTSGSDYVTLPSNKNGAEITITGKSAGTSVISDTPSVMGISNAARTFTVNVMKKSSGGETSADTKNGTINVRVNWSNASDPADSVTVKLSALNEEEKTVTLNSANSWTADATGLNINKTYGYNVSKITKISQDVTDQYDWEGSTSEDGGMITLTVTKKAAQAGLPDAYGDKASKITVTKSWADGTDPADSVTAEVKSTDGQDTQTVTLDNSNNWTATVDVDSSRTYSVTETKVTKGGKDVTDQYTAEVEKGDAQTSTGRGTVATKGTAGTYTSGSTYAFLYQQNGKTYALGAEAARNANNVVGLQVDNEIPSWAKWRVTRTTNAAASSTAIYSLYNINATTYKYLRNYGSVSMGQTDSSYYSRFHLDDDGSIWGTSDQQELLADGSSIGYGTNSNFTAFTPYLISGGTVTTTTTEYTITNTAKNSGGSGGGVTPADPAKSANGLNLSKTADRQGQNVNPDDEITLTLEAQSTGSTVTVSKSTPADILMVLDNTSSMTSEFGSGTRLSTMKTAAENFVDNLNLSDGSRIAMCSFVIGNYSSPTTNDVAWIALNDGSKSRVKAAIEGLSAPNDTGYDTVFLTPVNYVVNNMLTGTNPKYVVFFTDGDDVSDQKSLNTAINNLHEKADVVYSVAISSARYYYDDVEAFRAKAKSIASSPDYFYDVADAADMSTAFNNALKSIETQTSTSNTTLDSSAVFKDVVNTDKFDVSDATAKVSIYDYDAGGWNVLRNASVSAKAGSMGTLSSWTSKATGDGPLTIKFDKSTGAVTVTGFSYKDHYLPASGTEASGVNAQKLHVEISGLKLKAGAQTSEVQNDVHTNKDSESGISKKDGSLVANFPEPSVNIPAKEVKTTTLTVKQQINGDDPDTDKTFSFTAKITPEGGETETKTFTLKHNGTYELADVPVGAQVEIIQDEDKDYYLSKIDETDGINGEVDFSNRKYSVTAPETSGTVTFVDTANESHADAATGNDSVTVHKTVSKNEGDGDNEFTINLAIDTKTNVAKYYDTYFKTKAVYGATTSPNKELIPGQVYDASDLSGNSKVTVGTTDQGKDGDHGTFTIKDSKGNTLVTGLTLYWSQANNVCFYAKLPGNDNKVVVIAVAVTKKSNIVNQAVNFTEEADQAMENAVKAETNAVTLRTVEDKMGSYIIYNGSVKENDAANPSNVTYDSSGKTLTWNSPKKNTSAVTTLTSDTNSEGKSVQVYETKNYATLSYKVKLDVDKTGFKNASTGETFLNGYHTGNSIGSGSSDGTNAVADSGSATVTGNWYNTNDHATLTYRTSADTTDQMIDFPTPLVQGTKPDVPLTGTNTRQPAAWILLALCLTGAAYLIWRRRRSI